MGADTLIFLSTGKVHTAIRNILLENIPALKNVDLTKDLKIDLGIDEGINHNNKPEVIKRALIRTLFNTMFSSQISEDIVQAYVDYASYGALCVLGTDFHSLTGNYFLPKIESIRNKIKGAILETPIGKSVKEAAAKAAEERSKKFSQGINN
jgi:hypothetical protein